MLMYKRLAISVSSNLLICVKNQSCSSILRYRAFQMIESRKQTKIYFENLDVIRFIAAFMIVILHAYEAWCGWFGEVGFLTGGTYKEFTPTGKYIDQFIRNLGIGVDIFFLISGFLITYILIEEKKRFNKIHIGKFMMRRTLRIWPLYFLLIGIAPFLVSWLDSNTPNYLANLFFVGNFEIIHSQTWTYPFSHFWSICIEEHFYLVWPFIIYLIPRKYLITTFIALILFSISFRIYSFTTMDHPWYTLFLHTFSRIDVLVIGAIGAFFYAKKQFVFKLHFSVRYLLLAILIVALSIEPEVLWDTAFMAGFRKYFYIGLIAVLLLDFNFNPNLRHLLPNKSFIHYLGKISYGIYMYGNILLLFVIKKIMWTFQITNMWAFFFIVIVLSIAIPIISYELIEKPILKLNKHFRVIQTDR